LLKISQIGDISLSLLFLTNKPINMKKFLSLSALLLFVLLNATHSQQVISTSGGYFENENISLSWTVGEPVIATFNAPGIMLTQGFQQPWSFYLQQILNIPVGWSGISGYIDPLNKNVENIFAPWENDLIILASMTGVYWPETGTNTLGNWDYSTGYQIKALNDFDITLTGSKISDPTVDIPQGWSLLPVLVACETPVEDLFSGVDDLIIVKQVAGVNLYWPAYNINTLGNLIPGKAYFVALNEAESIEFPACNNKSYKQQPQPAFVNRTTWNDPTFSASTHSIAFPSKVIAASEINSGDVIGVFDAFGVCFGMAEIASPAQSIALTAFGNDLIAQSKIGFDYGEQFQFRVFRPATQEEMVLEVGFDHTLPQTSYFADHGLSAVNKLKLQPLNIQQQTQLSFTVYPNPSQGKFNLTLYFTPQKPIIRIMDARGGIVRVIEPIFNPDGSTITIDLTGIGKGVYFLNLVDEQFSGVKKIIIN
jgi:hypothetical protein